VGSETLLIVDGDEEQLDIAVKNLGKLGCQVVTAASGEEGLEIVERVIVDLVVLDMVMPGGMDGLESYRKMKDYRYVLKAVIISGFSESDRVPEVQRLGAGPLPWSSWEWPSGQSLTGLLQRKVVETRR